MAYSDLSTLSEDWRREHDYHKVQSYLYDFKGVSQKQRVMDDLSRFLLRSKLEWAYRNGIPSYSQEVALVTVTDPETNEILDLGGTLPGDLFGDNFGNVLAGLCQVPGSALRNTPNQLKDTGAASRTMPMYNINGAANLGVFTFSSTTNFNTGTQIQIGSGTTAPARADTAIQTAFGTAPESAAFSTGAGAYTAGSGTVTVSGSITSGGSGTINEAVWLFQGIDSALNAQRTYLFAHDATTATPFTASKSITVQYSIAD